MILYNPIFIVFNFWFGLFIGLLILIWVTLPVDFKTMVDLTPVHFLVSMIPRVTSGAAAGFSLSRGYVVCLISAG